MMHEVLSRLAITADNIGIPKVEANDTTIGQIVGSVFIAIGSIAVLFLLIGAARYMASNGEQNRITQAKNTILYAIVGIVISALGFTIVQFVIGRITGNL
ncbi:MAG TPA: hypothetical protein VLA88_06625 [Candidatus Saccharimonadales bacterium]|nr:hypothetical protein [Candidatus Saccharimonadales bacterium]